MSDPTSKLVPNEFPTIKAPYRIAFIGDSPGFDEVNAQQPFMGQAGRMLEGSMQAVGIARRACYLGNVMLFRPQNNNLSRVSWNSSEIQGGLAVLADALREFKPHIVVLLGEAPLKAALDPVTVHPLVQARFKHSVANYRGSVFMCDKPESPFFGFKCMATYHPAKVLRQYDLLPLFQFDLRRARQEGDEPDLNHTPPRIDIDLSPFAVIDRLQAIQPGTLTSIDIEGGIVAQTISTRTDPITKEKIRYRKDSCVPCLAISTRSDEAFVISFGRYSEYEERLVMNALSKLCYDHTIPKLFQNGSYDVFVLYWVFGFLVRNHAHDTMLSGWEHYPEFPKSLGFQASLWTKEPYWKFERKTDDHDTFLRYCGKDAAITLAIHEAQMKAFTPEQQKHYEFNCRLLPILTYAQIRGIRWDRDAAKEMSDMYGVKLAESLTRLRVEAKNNEFNPNSAIQVCNFLYNKCGFPTQYKVEGGRKTNKRTADKLSLLKLLKKFPGDKIIADLLWYRKVKKLKEQSDIKTDADGRVRCSYNAVGTTTGRLSSSQAPTGTGMNLQTVTKDLRHLCRADDGHYFFQVDLEGADGWTVACHCTNLGDTTMIEDYSFGIKPAQAIALMYMLQREPYKLEKEIEQHGNNLAHWTREAIKTAAKKHVDKDGWLYFASKRVQHGGNYGLGKIQMSNQILQDSYKLHSEPILLTAGDCDNLKRLYLDGRYMGVKLWQRWVKGELLNRGALSSASGHTRRFFGRRNDNSVINAALSHEPQANTAYSTNLGLGRIWSDESNRDEHGNLIVQPLHQVHDAVCGQFPIDKTDWAIKKLKEWMHNEITIAGIPLVIPYEGEYGPSWGDMSVGTIYMDDPQVYRPPLAD